MERGTSGSALATRTASNALTMRTARQRGRPGRVIQPGPAPASALMLLGQARNSLADADWEPDPAEKYMQSYLSAIRAAAAVLALHGRPHRGRSRPTSVWVLLSSIAPELGEWAAFFEASSATCASARAGVTRAIDQRAADDMSRQAGQFLALVERAVHGRDAA